jgi:hypothetical protein
MREKWEYPKDHNDLNHLRFEQKHKQKVLQNVSTLGDTKENSKFNLKMKPVILTGVSTVALVFFLIGSTYVSPAMAKVVANLPYFSQFMKKEEYKLELNDTVYSVIRENQYKLRDLEISIPKKKVVVTIIGTKEEVNSMKEDVITNIQSAIQEGELGEYSVLVKSGKDFPKDSYKSSPEEEEQIRQSEKLQKKIIELLKQHNYVTAFPIEARINKVENFLYVAVPNTESKERMELLKELLRDATKEYGEFKMRITRIDMAAREQELRWEKNGIVHIIGSGLMENKEFKVKGYSYSFHPLPLQLIIKTSVLATDPEASKVVERIEKEITEFIQTDEKTKDIRNDPYELTILSKDKKKIN